MRFIRTIVIVLLVISVVGNVLLYSKNARRQAQIKINNKVITKKDYYDWLEQHDGLNMMAVMTKYYLLMQAAEKAGVSPTKEEVEKEMQLKMEANPNLVAGFQSRPWLKLDQIHDVEMAFAAINLTTKGIVATDDEIKEYYDISPTRWDDPTKFHLKALIAKDKDTADRVQVVLQNLIKPSGNAASVTKFPVPDLEPVLQQFEPKIAMLFDRTDGAWIVSRAVSNPVPDNIGDQVAQMKPGEVIKIKAQENKYMILALEYVELGKHGQLSDPEVKKRVTREFKLTRSQPVQELLRSLFDASNIETDPPESKVYIEDMLLPERRKVATASQKPAQ